MTRRSASAPTLVVSLSATPKPSNAAQLTRRRAMTWSFGAPGSATRYGTFDPGAPHTERQRLAVPGKDPEGHDPEADQLSAAFSCRLLTQRHKTGSLRLRTATPSSQRHHHDRVRAGFA